MLKARVKLEIKVWVLCFMSKTTFLVLGGCKSGKSSYALNLANGMSKEARKVFIATSVPADSEMEERVLAHQKERGPDWLSLEEPLDIAEVIKDHSRLADVILVDCLTLWVSNLLYKGFDKKEIITRYVEELISSVEDAECSVIMVSNEVGFGIVPENKLARLFRDIAGITNQEIAKSVSRVVFTMAGIPVNIKG